MINTIQTLILILFASTMGTGKTNPVHVLNCKSWFGNPKPINPSGDLEKKGRRGPLHLPFQLFQGGKLSTANQGSIDFNYTQVLSISIILQVLSILIRCCGYSYIIIVILAFSVCVIVHAICICFCRIRFHFKYSSRH